MPEPSAAHNPDLAQAGDELLPELREVLLLRHGAQLTFDQLAEVVGLPRGTVVARHAAALERLRSQLAPHDTTQPQETCP